MNEISKKSSFLSVVFIVLTLFNYLNGNNKTDIEKNKIIQNYLKNSDKSPIELVIDKTDKTIQLYENDKLLNIYPITLGFNPISDKIKSGDGCTPEGVFRIMDKHPSKYFTWFLELNYPNIEDAIRGLKDKLITENQYNSIINSNLEETTNIRGTKLGDSIGIHTSGIQGKYGSVTDSDWTLGCIAVEYKDMQNIYNKSSINTPVLVIGTNLINNFKTQENLMKNLDEITLDVENKLRSNDEDEAKSQLNKTINEYELFNKTKLVPDSYKLDQKVSFLYHYLSFLESNTNPNIAYEYAEIALKLKPTSIPYQQNLAKLICLANKKDRLNYAEELLRNIPSEDINNATEFKIISANIEFLKGNITEAKNIASQIQVNKEYSELMTNFSELIGEGVFDYQIYNIVRNTPFH